MPCLNSTVGLWHNESSNVFSGAGLRQLGLGRLAMEPFAQEDVFFTILGILFFAMAFFWIGFARLTMARIEREMKRDGLTRPSAWDGVGYRALWYAYAIVLPVGDWNRRDDPFIDVPTVRSYAKPFDRKLGLLFMISGFLFLFLVLLGGPVLGYY